MAALGVVAVVAPYAAGLVLMRGTWWLWPIAAFCGGWAIARIYRMGQTDGIEYGDYND